MCRKLPTALWGWMRSEAPVLREWGKRLEEEMEGSQVMGRSCFPVSVGDGYIYRCVQVLKFYDTVHVKYFVAFCKCLLSVMITSPPK